MKFGNNHLLMSVSLGIRDAKKNNFHTISYSYSDYQKPEVKEVLKELDFRGIKYIHDQKEQIIKISGL